jgi:hypothetical protein
MATGDRFYPSKRGFVVYALLAMLGTMIVSYFYNRLFLPGILCLGLTGVVIFPIVFNTNYTITADNLLKIKCGFFMNITLPIASISKLTPCRSILSAPALSFDRLEIFYGEYDSVVISPENRDDFIDQLQTINPAIVCTVGCD